MATGEESACSYIFVKKTELPESDKSEFQLHNFSEKKPENMLQTACFRASFNLDIFSGCTCKLGFS